MKVLLVHNHYLQPGGEDGVFAAEAALLESRGHAVRRYTVHNEAVERLGRLALARATVWNGVAHSALRRVLQAERPAVMHVHNTLPLLSPAIYYAAQAESVAVVQTLHNFRLVCPKGFLARGGRVCEECLGKSVPLPAVAHACYRDSRAASGTVAAMLTAHRLLGTWQSRVDAYIALTEFARGKFIEGGLPAERIRVKPNFIGSDPGVGAHAGRFALFVGRLSPEKGIDTLVEGWRRAGTGLALKIAGDGPLAGMRATSPEGIEWLGRRPKREVFSLMKKAAFLIFPSHWYEGFPLTLLEAFATGLPVIASRLGAMSEMICDGSTGLHFTSGDADDLAAKIRWAVAHRQELAEIGRRARRAYETEFTVERNYEMLMEIYDMAIREASGRRTSLEAIAGSATSGPTPA